MTSSVPFAAFALLLLALGAPPAAAGEKIREYYPDGALKAEYVVDVQGRKNGLYREFHHDGKNKVRVIFKTDAMDGPYESWHPNGKPFITCRYQEGVAVGAWKEAREDGSLALSCSYKDGKLDGVWRRFDEAGRLQEECAYRAGRRHGQRRLLQGGEVLSEQEWQDDLLVGLFGSRLLYATTLDDVRRTLAGLLADPALAELARLARESGDPQRALAAQRAEALARLRGYRYLAGVPWRDVAAEAAAEERASLAAELAAAVGTTNYAPENPGWEEARFTRAREALQRCNLAQGWTLPDAIGAWMHPDDPALFPKLTARRLCLEPRMARLGLGRSGTFSALWTGDASGPVWRETASFYPARGWMPVEWFDRATPWSVRLNLADWRMPDEEQVRVTVRALDENYVRHGEPFALEYFRCERETIIFRPQASALPNFLYWVEVAGLERADGTPCPLAWLVHFVSAAPEAAADGADPDTSR